MATVLDVGLVQYFDAIYAVILVFALVFALLQKTEVIGKSIGINSIIAVAISFMVLLSRTLIDVINFMIPWFVVALIFFVLLILIFQTFGMKESTLATALQNKAVYWPILAIAIIIMVAAFGSVLGQTFLEQAATVQAEGELSGSDSVASGNFEKNVLATLFHPKVLGLVIVFVIAIFAVALLSGE